MDLNPQLAELAVRLGEIGARGSVASIRTRIATTKASKRDQEIIEDLDEIVDQLISERTELLGIAQAFEEELVAQRISDDDIEFITSELTPKVEQLLQLSGTQTPANLSEIRSAIEVFISKETVQILQVLGFNFRDAIGRPLTELIARLISSRASAAQVQDPEALQRLNLEVQLMAGQLSTDPDAYARFMFMLGRGPDPSEP